MKIVIDLTDKEIEKLDEMIGIPNKEYDEDIVDAVHILIEQI